MSDDCTEDGCTEEEPEGDANKTGRDCVNGEYNAMMIAKGKMISRSDFKKDFVVSKGSIVIITVQKGNLKIQAHGKALEDGTLGQLIRVISLNSNKERIGKVAGRNQIRIHF